MAYKAMYIHGRACQKCIKEKFFMGKLAGNSKNITATHWSKNFQNLLSSNEYQRKIPIEVYIQ